MGTVNLYREIYSQLQLILDTKTVPPIVLKEIKKYQDHYDIVLEVLRRFGDNFRESIRARNIENSFYVARYIAACIENHYRTIEKEFAELQQHTKERTVEAPVDISTVSHTNKHKDLSALIGGL